MANPTINVRILQLGQAVIEVTLEPNDTVSQALEAADLDSDCEVRINGVAVSGESHILEDSTLIVSTSARIKNGGR